MIAKNMKNLTFLTVFRTKLNIVYRSWHSQGFKPRPNNFPCQNEAEFLYTLVIPSNEFCFSKILLSQTSFTNISPFSYCQTKVKIFAHLTIGDQFVSICINIFSFSIWFLWNVFLKKLLLFNLSLVWVFSSFHFPVFSFFFCN